MDWLALNSSAGLPKRNCDKFCWAFVNFIVLGGFNFSKVNFLFAYSSSTILVTVDGEMSNFSSISCLLIMEPGFNLSKYFL